MERELVLIQHRECKRAHSHIAAAAVAGKMD